MLVIVVDLADIGVVDDDVRKISQRLDAMGEPYGQERQSEACRREQSFGGQWGSPVPSDEAS